MDSDDEIQVELSPDEIRRQKLIFHESIERIVIVENHHYKLYNDQGEPDYYKIAKILNRICREKNIKIEVSASDQRVNIESPCWATESPKLTFIIKWFRKFWRHQRDMGRYLDL